MATNLPALRPEENKQLVALGVERLPALVHAAGKDAWRAYLNFFGGSIENENTRTSYLRDVNQFLEACTESGVTALEQLEPFIIQAYLKHHAKGEKNPGGWSKATAKRKLAALRKFFDHLVVSQVLAKSPALSVRGPKLKVRKGKTKVISLEELQQLTESIDRSTLVGKRDYAWLVLAATSWCRVTALQNLSVRDYEQTAKRSFIHVEEKGGEVDRMPVHHKAQEALDELLAAAGLTDKKDTKDSPIFQSVTRAGDYTGRPWKRDQVYKMVRRRARQAGVPENISCHTFRGTGITEYLKAGGRIEMAQRRAHHTDSRTTKIYDHSDDDITLEDVELVQF